MGCRRRVGRVRRGRLVLAEEYPGNPNPRPAALEQEDLLDDPLRLALPERAARPDADGPMTALRSLADHPWVMEPRARPPGTGP
ncbi:hypothetical protein ABIE67_007345 [Streptomyces sp. V4I8]|uniref:hypothetical protein n=1 Tax=Streptomyces sp. V4I8 TaxID=3156469 RepID=UPI00351987B6